MTEKKIVPEADKQHVWKVNHMAMLLWNAYRSGQKYASHNSRWSKQARTGPVVRGMLAAAQVILVVIEQHEGEVAHWKAKHLEKQTDCHKLYTDLVAASTRLEELTLAANQEAVAKAARKAQLDALQSRVKELTTERDALLDRVEVADHVGTQLTEKNNQLVNILDRVMDKWVQGS